MCDFDIYSSSTTNYLQHVPASDAYCCAEPGVVLE